MYSKTIAVVGATGNVGRKVVERLLQQKLAKPDKLQLFASPQSFGKKLTFMDQVFSIETPEKSNFEGVDLCLFNTESDVSAKYVPLALQCGAYVVDSSSFYRLNDDVPLIIPPVNSNLVVSHQKLYAHANCLASPIATVIAPLHKSIGVKKASAVTYQSTSGAGKGPMDECWNETKSVMENTPFTRKHFPRQIAFNVIPQVGCIRDDGFSFEEYKIIHEVRKVVGKEIQITATAVRVPVMVGHSVALSLELENSFDRQEIIEILKNATSVQLSKNEYSTPIEIIGSDDVFVGRIRKDPWEEKKLHLWLCSDNLFRGASTDAVEIATQILKLG